MRKQLVVRGHFRMARHKSVKQFSRRTFLQGMSWAPMLFVPAPLRYLPFGARLCAAPRTIPSPSLSDLRWTPHYPAKSPLDDVLRLVAPGTDEYITERYAAEIERLLMSWSQALKVATPALTVLANFLDASLEGTSLASGQENSVRSGGGIEVTKRRFPANLPKGRERFLNGVKQYFASFSHLETAQFEITGIREMSGSSPLTLHAEIRYEIVGTRIDGGREGRIGSWSMRWVHVDVTGWRAVRWEASLETVSRAPEAIFADVTAQALGQTDSYKNQ